MKFQEDLINDLESFPPWRYSCYGYNDTTPLIISGTDVSFEELRCRYYQSVILNDIEYYNEFVSQAEANISTKIHEIVQNPKLAADNINMQIRSATIEEPSSASAFSGSVNRIGASIAPASSFGASKSAFGSSITASAFSSTPAANSMSVQQGFGASTAPAAIAANNPASSGFSFASAFQSPQAAAPAAAFQASGFGDASQTTFRNSASSAFGNSASTAFGNSASTAFGNSASSAFGNSAGSAFGMAINSQQSAFGQPSLPGSGQVQTKTSAFGAASSNTPTKFPSSGFGTSGFGVSSSQPSGLASGASSAFASNSSFFQQQTKKTIFSKTVINGVYENHNQFGPSADIIKQCVCGQSSDGLPSDADILAYKQPEFELNCVPEFPPPYELIAPN
ncbi:hypothetical protein AYI69_g1949 [Smittium culicis]|uniref:Uncharacterized protein n=1 Tax=Smittium culicis TaxID=133412 RepID=A0A1R1YP14_9FUNG|nr:hypothetical protein AYI69_g1949 [Smittium culicis]